MDSKWVFLLNCKVLLYQILCPVTIISQVTENHRVHESWVYKRRSRSLQWELPKLHSRLIWLRNELWVCGRSSTKLMGKGQYLATYFYGTTLRQEWNLCCHFKLNVLLFLHVTSQRPCWWPRTTSGNGLWELNTILYWPATWPPCHVVVNRE